MVRIGRAINGIPLNGLEYLSDADGTDKIFKTKQEAKEFLLENGYESYTDDNLEDAFIFRTLEEDIEDNTESLETTEGDSVECISIENLQGILYQYKVLKDPRK